MYSFNISTSHTAQTKKKKILISNQYCEPFHWTCSETLEHKSCYRAHFSERDGNILIGTSWKALPHWKPVRRAHPPPRKLQPHQNPLMNLASDISLVFTLVRPQSRNNVKPYFQVSCPDCSAGGPREHSPTESPLEPIPGKAISLFSPFTNFKAVLIISDFADPSRICGGQTWRIF